MSTLTAGQIAADLDADLGHFAAELEIPVLGGLQAQGDLYIIPVAPKETARAIDPLPTGGEVLLAGRGGNAHTLGGDPAGIFWTRFRPGQTLGLLTVKDGYVAYLFHAPAEGARRFAEHAPNAISPGTYVIRRQREKQDEVRLVAD